MAQNTDNVHLQAVISVPVSTMVIVNTSVNGAILDAEGNPLGNSFTMPDGADVTVQIKPDAGYQIAQVLFNGQDLTGQIDSNGYLRLPFTTGSVTLSVAYKALPAAPLSSSAASLSSAESSIKPSATGDTHGPGLYILLAFLSAAALFVTQRKKAARP